MTVNENIRPSRIIRLTFGQVSLTTGVFWLVISLPHAVDRQAFVGAALAGGGLVLLLWRRVRLPGRLVAAAAVVAGVTGTVAGLAVRSTGTGGMFGWFEDRGWPFAWLGRGAVADSVDEAHRQAVAGGWGTDLLRMFADVTVWAYTGMVVVVVAGLARRAYRDRTS